MKPSPIFKIFLSACFLALPVVALANFANDAECDAYCSTACQNNLYAAECTTDCQADVCYLQGNQQSETEVDAYVSSYAPENPTTFASEVTCINYCGEQICPQACPNNQTTCVPQCSQTLCTDDKWQTVSGENITSFTSTMTQTCQGTSTGSTETTISVTNPLGNTEAARNPVEIIGNVVRALLVFLGVITLVMFIYGGVMMMTSAGNEERFKKGRNVLLWTIIGLAIVLSSYAILDFVFTRLLSVSGGG